MKRFAFILPLILVFSFLNISCKDSNKVKSADSPNVMETVIGEEEEEETTKDNIAGNLIVENEGEYVNKDLNIFENTDFVDRIKPIVEEVYEEILENFNTETPIVSDRDIYKFTGCKAHDCPSYLITFLYDAKNDNFNVLINQNGRVKVYEENGKVTVTKKLRAK